MDPGRQERKRGGHLSAPEEPARGFGRFLVAVIAAFSFSAGAVGADVTPQHGDPSVPLRPVAVFDPARYAGLWFEIARFPNRHQRRCAAGTAEYVPRPDGHLTVRGTCPDRFAQRAAVTREGVARLDGPGELSIGLNAWLPLFRRTVVLLDLVQDEGVAVLGEPRRKYGWILARRPEISRRAYRRALQVLAENGYWIDKIELLAPVR